MKKTPNILCLAHKDRTTTSPSASFKALALGCPDGKGVEETALGFRTKELVDTQNASPRSPAKKQLKKGAVHIHRKSYKILHKDCVVTGTAQ